MSKRLNKRQLREAGELAELKNQQAQVSKDVSKSEEEEVNEGVVNPFAALDAKAEEEEEEGEDLEATLATPKKTAKKKKPKRKKASATLTPAMEEDGTAPAMPSVSTPGKETKSKTKGQETAMDGMDEVDQALAELKLKYGEESTSANAGSSRNGGSPSESMQFMSFRNSLSVDPKNLDADAELRRFFGSKVIASSAQSGGNRHRPAASSKLRYTISRPKPSYPPATSLAGLGMRELTEEEVDEIYERRGLEMVDLGEKWFTFEHSGPWREVERQFMGAVRSHDPNELMALLQVYPWHVDTLLQMSEVYRLQSDIGAASDYAERALYAFDRCLIPGFNVMSGSSRLDFDRVENRPMFTALHRIISYLGRRGCWVTAFNFAKLLFALDPLGDPHGSALWLDFLAVKSNNGAWLISILEQRDTTPAAAALHAYPGMAYGRALALRAQEDAAKDQDRVKSDSALRTAIQTFPQVISILADKIGASLPDGGRSNPLLRVEAAHTDSPSDVMHLLSHVYVARSEALWKEASNLSWFESQVAAALPTVDSSEAKAFRSDALAIMQSVARDPVDDTLNIPLHICRHVLCSESTSWLGFLPPLITSRPFHAFDPLPPNTAISAYDAECFTGVRTPSRAAGGRRGMVQGFMEGIMEAVAQDPGENLQERLLTAWRQLMGEGGMDDVPEGERDNMLQRLLQLAGGLQEQRAGQTGGGGMPGGFPGQRREEDDV